jgi:hypothetical protein
VRCGYFVIFHYTNLSFPSGIIFMTIVCHICHRNITNRSLKLKMVKKCPRYERPTSNHKLNFPSQIFHGTELYVYMYCFAHTMCTYSSNLFYFPWFNFTSRFYVSMIFVP